MPSLEPALRAFVRFDSCRPRRGQLAASARRGVEAAALLGARPLRTWALAADSGTLLHSICIALNEAIEPTAQDHFAEDLHADG